MNSKLLILAVMCFASLASGSFARRRSSVIGVDGVVGEMVGDLASIGAKTIEKKVNAVSKAAVDIISAGSSAGEKSGIAVVDAASSVAGASIHGISSAAVSIARSVPKLFMSLLGGMSSGSSGFVIGDEIVDEEPIVIEYEPAIEFPARPVEVDVFQAPNPVSFEVVQPMPIVAERVAPVWTSLEKIRSRGAAKELIEVAKAPRYIEAGPLIESFRFSKK